MKEFDPSIVDYMQEQLPDIQDTYEDAVLGGDYNYAQYLAGITEAYEHIINKFGSLYEGS